MNTGILYIVATPIGNLGDITLRALETLKTVDVVLCEDTRVTATLLNEYEIKKPLLSCHHHSDGRKLKEIQKELQNGKNIALVTDAGTPGISDPGNELIEYLRLKIEDFKIVPIPGPSAVITSLSIAGFPTDKFLFLGFPPHKNKRNKYFDNACASEYTTVFYESGHRIKKCLEELATRIPTRQLVVAREMTKKFETIYRGIAADILEKIDARGEFVVILANQYN